MAKEPAVEHRTTATYTVLKLPLLLGSLPLTIPVVLPCVRNSQGQRVGDWGLFAVAQVDGPLPSGAWLGRRRWDGGRLPGGLGCAAGAMGVCPSRIPSRRSTSPNC
jgi:hypothetical protein